MRHWVGLHIKIMMNRKVFSSFPHLLHYPPHLIYLQGTCNCASKSGKMLSGPSFDIYESCSSFSVEECSDASIRVLHREAAWQFNYCTLNAYAPFCQPQPPPLSLSLRSLPPFRTEAHHRRGMRRLCLMWRLCPMRLSPTTTAAATIRYSTSIAEPRPSLICAAPRAQSLLGTQVEVEAGCRRQRQQQHGERQ